MHTLTKAAGVLGVAAAAVLAAAPAHATPTQDAQYLALITNPPAGFQRLEFVSADAAIIEAKAVCGVLDDGVTLDRAAYAVDQVLDVDAAGAVTVVAAAVAVYCPWHIPARGPAA